MGVCVCACAWVCVCVCMCACVYVHMHRIHPIPKAQWQVIMIPSAFFNLTVYQTAHTNCTQTHTHTVLPRMPAYSPKTLGMKPPDPHADH